ncbi:MAG: hypothetical protein LGB02_05410 [Sulfurovum sp.]|nr:hypothetical protein [Sulfurovum sp.]
MHLEKKAQLDSKYKIAYEQISLRYFGAGVKLDKIQKDIFVSSKEIDSKYFTQEGDVVVRLRHPVLLYIKRGCRVTYSLTFGCYSYR